MGDPASDPGLGWGTQPRIQGQGGGPNLRSRVRVEDPTLDPGLGWGTQPRSRLVSNTQFKRVRPPISKQIEHICASTAASEGTAKETFRGPGVRAPSHLGVRWSGNVRQGLVNSRGSAYLICIVHCYSGMRGPSLSHCRSAASYPEDLTFIATVTVNTRNCLRIATHCLFHANCESLD